MCIGDRRWRFFFGINKKDFNLKVPTPQKGARYSEKANLASVSV